jgi:AcrR family transcriptional regulator
MPAGTVLPSQPTVKGPSTYYPRGRPRHRARRPRRSALPYGRPGRYGGGVVVAGAGGPCGQDRERTPDGIARVALELFAAKGYAGASVRDIAEAMGLTKAGVSYHFPAKEDLLHYLVEPVLEAVERVLESASGVKLSSAREVLAAYLGVVLEHRQVVRLVVNDPAVVHHPSLGPRIADQHQRLRDLLVGPNAGTAQHVRASAALGALRRPVLALPSVEAGELGEVVLDAAMAVLGETSGTPRRRPRPLRAPTPRRR